MIALSVYLSILRCVILARMAAPNVAFSNHSGVSLLSSLHIFKLWNLNSSLRLVSDSGAQCHE